MTTTVIQKRITPEVATQFVGDLLENSRNPRNHH